MGTDDITKIQTARNEALCKSANCPELRLNKRCTVETVSDAEWESALLWMPAFPTVSAR